MSDIYEHLIQRYGEEIAQGAEDFMTPRDAVRLAVSLIFTNEDEFLNSDDGACTPFMTAHVAPVVSSATRSTCWTSGRIA